MAGFSFALFRRETAVDGQRPSRNISRGVGCKEYGRPDQVIEPAVAADRGLRGETDSPSGPPPQLKFSGRQPIQNKATVTSGTLKVPTIVLPARIAT
jgi:hypothetical protein